MKIALLTCSYSVLIDHLGRILHSEELIVVDFSKGGELADICESKSIAYIRFSSWGQLADALHEVELILSYKLNRIIPIEIVDKCKFGGLNIHPSLLPEYPGLNPWFDMYVDMNLNTGVTIHKIEAKPDCGDIIVQKSFAINPGQPLSIAMDQADEIAAQLITDVIVSRTFLNRGIKQHVVDMDLRGTINLESLKHMSVERLWHILRGFPSLIHTLYPELPHKYFEAGEYTETSSPETAVRIIIGQDGSRQIACYDGFISLHESTI